MKDTCQLSTAFVRQFKHISGYLEVAVNRCPDQLWLKAKTKTSPSPAWIAYHAARTLEMSHMINIPPSRMPPGPRDADVPTKEELARLIEAVSTHVKLHIQGLTDCQILAATAGDKIPCARNLLYSLRHAQHHVGSFAEILRQNQIRPPAWSTANMM